MTDLIERISKILKAAGVIHECDPTLKAPDSSVRYYRINNSRNHNILSHYFSINKLNVVVKNVDAIVKTPLGPIWP